MDWSVRSMTCRHGACCPSGLNCPWWHSVEEVKIFKDELELQRRKLAVRCGFFVWGECQFGADCRRTKRLAEFGSTRIESVAPTDLRGDARDKEVFTFGSGAADAAVVSGDNGNVGGADGDGDSGFRVVGAEGAKAQAFGRKRVGVVKRPSAVEGAG